MIRNNIGIECDFVLQGDATVASQDVPIGGLTTVHKLAVARLEVAGDAEVDTDIERAENARLEYDDHVYGRALFHDMQVDHEADMSGLTIFNGDVEGPLAIVRNSTYRANYIWEINWLLMETQSLKLKKPWTVV